MIITINIVELQALNQPCACILARHNGGAPASKVAADKAGGLENHVVFAISVKVMITWNIWQAQGLIKQFCMNLTFELLNRNLFY